VKIPLLDGGFWKKGALVRNLRMIERTGRKNLYSAGDYISFCQMEGEGNRSSVLTINAPKAYAGLQGLKGGTPMKKGDTSLQSPKGATPRGRAKL